MRLQLSLTALCLIALPAASCGAVDEQQVEEIISGVAQTAEAGITYVPATPDVNTIVQQTFAAMTIEAGAPLVTPQGGQGATDNISTDTPEGGQTGSVTGGLSYPSEGIPPIEVVAYRVGGQPNEYYYVLTQQNQATYLFDFLPPGTYYVVAYPMLEGNDLAGGYSQAVPCGLSVNCTDHSLIPVVVQASQITSGINPADWYAPPGSFPANPIP